MSLEIEELTDDELYFVVGDMPAEVRAAWAIGLAKWIRDNVTQPCKCTGGFP